MNIKNVGVRKKRTSDSIPSVRSGSKILLAIAFGLMSLQLAGCSSLPTPDIFDGTLIDKVFSDYRDNVWAKRACNLRYSNCNRPYASHFESGFEAGYVDICNGGDGYVPATPPECYWGFDYQTPDGAQCVNAWFEGYPAGVAAAKRDHAGTYRDVFVSRMIQSAIKQDNATKLHRRTFLLSNLKTRFHRSLRMGNQDRDRQHCPIYRLLHRFRQTSHISQLWC